MSELAPEKPSPKPKLERVAWPKRLWRFFKRLTKVFSFSVLSLVLLLIFLLHFSFFQTWLAEKGLNYINKNTTFRAEIKSLYLNFYRSTLDIQELSIRDQQDQMMVFAEGLKADFHYSEVFNNGDVLFDEVNLDKTVVNIITSKKDSLVNFTKFINEILLVFKKKEPRDPNTEPAIIQFSKVSIQDSYFSFEDQRKVYQNGENIDFAHFGIDDLQGELENLRIAGDTIEAKVFHLGGIEPRVDFRIHHLESFFRFTERSMDFRNLNLQMGNSTIGNELFLKYRHPRNLANFVDSVTVVAYFDSSFIDTDDLAYFAPAVKPFKDTWRISGLMRGRINDFTVRNLDLAWAEDSHLRGEVEFEGLPNIQETFMSLNFSESQLNPQELAPYLDQPQVLEVMARFGLIRYQADFIGFVNDFVANGDFYTEIGQLSSNINLKLNPNPNQSYYKGELQTRNLNLGKMLDQTSLGFIDMLGTIEGQGFNPELAHLSMDAKIKRLGFNGYDYQDIEAKGELSKLRFDGELEALDPNFNLDIIGYMDFNTKPNEEGLPPGRFDLKGEIENIDLQALNFVPKPTRFRGKLNVDTHGLNLDSLTGSIDIYEANINYDNNLIPISDFQLISFKKAEKERFFALSSDFLDFEADGDFIFSIVFADLQELIQEYILIFQNHPEEIEDYYAEKKQLEKDQYNFHFEASLKNLNPVLALFVDTTKVYVSSDAQLNGNFSQGLTTAFQMFTKETIPAFAYNDFRFEAVDISLNTTKIVDGPEVFAEFSLNSKKQVLKGVATEKLFTNVTWGGDLIDFGLEIQQTGSDNIADIDGNMHFTGDTTLLNFERADLQFLNEKWAVDPDNQVNINPRGLAFKSLRIFNDTYNHSSLSVSGELSEKTENPLIISAETVELFPFADFIGRDVRGILNAQVKIQKELDKFLVFGKTTLENLLVDKVLVGDIDGKVNWDEAKNELGIEGEVFRQGKYILDLFGSYAPLDKESPLKLTADLNRTNLEIAEPFVSFLFSNIRGNASGRLNIRGDLNRPVITGKLKIPNGRLRVNYLNTTYDLLGEVYFYKNEIKASDMSVFDSQDNPAKLDLSLRHNNFQDIRLALQSNFFNFQLLNTQAKDNALFYGSAYATGSLKVLGPLNSLQMDINARSERNTKISLPLDGYEEVAQKEYIRFVKPGFSERDSSFIRKVNLGGLALNFNLDVNQNAEFEIIFDRKAGDIIRGSGKGLVEMDINPEGDLSLFGYYIIEKGKYNFTFANLVNKAFDIQPGSKVTFNGDMFDSQLDVDAVYKKNVPLSPLVDMNNVIDPENNEYRRPYPVSAILELQGKLLAPEIKLSLDLSEAKKTPNMTLQTAVYQLDNKVKGDDQERSRQVFSLLILNRLSPPNSFRGVGVAGTAGSSLSELLSNQFSNWLSQVDENLELSFDVDANDLNTFQLRVSYSLLDGRLRITRDGGFTNTQNQADFASVVGDWTVEYLLSPGGKYRVKVYNRSNQNVINSVNLNNNSTTTAGVSLVHTASFNRFREIFTSKKKNEPRGFRRKNKDQDLENLKTQEDPKDLKGTDEEKKPDEREEREVLPILHRNSPPRVEEKPPQKPEIIALEKPKTKPEKKPEPLDRIPLPHRFSSPKKPYDKEMIPE